GHDGFGQGVRHDGQLELGAVDAIHRQAGAVDRDGALEGDVPGQLAGRADAKLHRAGVVFAADDFAHAVDVAADQVAAQAAGGRQGLLQVDAAAGLQIGEPGARQGFAADVGPEAVAGQLDGGQAHAVDGDAVAELHIAQIQLAGLDVDADIATLGGNALNGADGFDYAGEHVTSRPRRETHCMERTPVFRGKNRALLIEGETDAHVNTCDEASRSLSSGL